MSRFRITVAEVVVIAVVVATVGALAWPGFMRSRRAANEAAAVATLREIGRAEIAYSAAYPSVGFAKSLAELSGRGEACEARPERACLLEIGADNRLVRQGYRFTAEGAGESPRTAFLSTAVPERVGTTGQLSFCSSNRWVVHYRADGTAARDGDSCEAWAAWR